MNREFQRAGALGGNMSMAERMKRQAASAGWAQKVAEQHAKDARKRLEELESLKRWNEYLDAEYGLEVDHG